MYDDEGIGTIGKSIIGVVVTIAVFGLLVFLMSLVLIQEPIVEARKTWFTEKEWITLEQAYCADFGMTTEHYIDDSYKGRPLTKTKCVGSQGERTIDYNHELFYKR